MCLFDNFFYVVNFRYLQGMYAFGLVETGYYKKAEKCALKVRKGSLKFFINFVFGFLYRHDSFPPPTYTLPGWGRWTHVKRLWGLLEYYFKLNI